MQTHAPTHPARHGRHCSRVALHCGVVSVSAHCPATGPGYYHSEAGGGDGPAFTMAGKLPAQAREASAAGLLPGPGHYEVSRACGASGAAFTMAGRLGTILEQQEPTPGPGGCLVHLVRYLCEFCNQ